MKTSSSTMSEIISETQCRHLLGMGGTFKTDVMKLLLWS